MSYPPKTWKPSETDKYSTTALNHDDVEPDFLPDSRQNPRLILKDLASEPHSTWLPAIHLQPDEKTANPSLVPEKPVQFDHELNVEKGKVFFDRDNHVIQINRSTGQRLAFAYKEGRVNEVTSDRTLSYTTDDTNWYFNGNKAPVLPDWRGRVETAPNGTVTVLRADERDIFRIDGSHTIERNDKSKIDFNPADRLTEMVAANGRKITLTYSYAGEMTSMRDPRGTYTTKNGYEWYHGDHKPPHAPDWLGTVSYSHNGSVSERSGSGLYKRWNFDGSSVAHYLNGRHLDVDKQGHVTRIVNANQQQTTFQYDSLGKMTEMSDQRGTYNTTDGINWYKSANTTRAQSDWRGTVTVSASSGLISEQNAETGSVHRWTLDGRHLAFEKLLPVSDFSKRAEQLFPQIDTDKNGYLSGSELGRALENPRFTGRDAQVVAALYKCRDDLRKLSDDELFSESETTKEDLREFDKLARQEPKNALVERVEWFLERTNNSQRDTLPCSLYQDEANPCASITYRAIMQGTIGDCYLEAVIASIAASSPGKIRDMIKDNGNGTYTVTFPGDRANPVTVSAPTEAEMGLNSEPGQYGIWPNVLEKAFGEYFVQHSYLGTKGYSSTEGADGGGFASRSTKLLTGKKVTEHWLSGWRSSSTNETIKGELTSAFAEGRAVTCSIGAIAHGQTRDGYTKRHVYSIIGWDPQGKDGGTLTIRNPWGNTTDGPGGTSTMSYRQYLKNFNVITIEGK
ncbi:MAG: C2 family cysteine protease [Candidatus Obscuribacterales bacterium]